MQKYQCPCGYIYNPESGDPVNGIEPGTAWRMSRRIGHALSVV